MTAPCKDCKDRFLGCHGSCKKYLEFKAETNKKRKMQFVDNEIDNVIYSGKVNRCEKMKHKRGII